VKAVAVVGKLTRGDLQQTGLSEPRDAAPFAIDGALGEAGLLEDSFDVPALSPQVMLNRRRQTDCTVGRLFAGNSLILFIQFPRRLTRFASITEGFLASTAASSKKSSSKHK